MFIYNTYMAYLASKHGGPKMFRFKKKHGLIEDYVPPKPRIKNTRELKYLKKHGILIGSVGRFLVNADAFDNIEEMWMGASDDVVVEHLKSSKGIEKLLDEEFPGKHLQSQSFQSDFDFLDNYFRNKNYSGGKNKSKDKKGKNGSGKFCITDIMSDDYERYLQEDDGDDDQNLALYNNILISNDTAKELEIYHVLNEAGWNSYKLMKKARYGKRVTGMFKPPKKKRKKKSSRIDGDFDGLLIDIMTDNGFEGDSFEDFQREMLNMTSENVFK